MHKVETENYSDSESENRDCESSSVELYVESIRKVDTKKPVSWLQPINVQDHKVTIKLDTG